MKFLDTESVGFSGPLLLIQTLSPEGKYIEHRVFDVPVSATLEFIEELLKEDLLVIFNASFDSFILHKWYNILMRAKDHTLKPIPKELEEIEKTFDHTHLMYLRPRKVLDLYILLRQTLFSFAVGRNKRPITIHKVPIKVASTLKSLLEVFALQLPSILFAKFKTKNVGDYWDIVPDKTDPKFVNLELRFSPNLGLKSIIRFLFPDEDAKEFQLPYTWFPEEREFAPWNTSWLNVFPKHIKYWTEDKSKEYAKNDVLYLKKLYDHLSFKSLIPALHFDSELAWKEGGDRVKGFKINIEKLKEMKKECQEALLDIPSNSPAESLRWIKEALPEPLRASIYNTNQKDTLIPLSKMTNLPEASKRAKMLIENRAKLKRLDIINKLLTSGRFFPHFNVFGTLSARMSGAGGINPQGIENLPKFREIFEFSDNNNHLSGGDFSSQEITILDALLDDPSLREILKENVRQIHIEMAKCIFNVEEPSADQYYKGKQAVYALVYGAQYQTLSKVLELPLTEVQLGLHKFQEKFPKLRDHLAKLEEQFFPLKQVGGLGTKITWHEPVKEAKPILGISRNFVFENNIIKYLFDLGTYPPVPLKKFQETIKRKDREQSLVGATQSAIFAEAFAIQSQNLRSAGNHLIQAPGAYVTKLLQYTILNQHQPFGVAPFHVQFYNVHDELIVVNTKPKEVEETVHKVISSLKRHIPLLSISWKMLAKNWADLKE